MKAFAHRMSDKGLVTKRCEKYTQLHNIQKTTKSCFVFEGTHQVVLRGYLWLCTQNSLLTSSGIIWNAREIEPGHMQGKNTLQTHCAIVLAHNSIFKKGQRLQIDSSPNKSHRWHRYLKRMPNIIFYWKKCKSKLWDITSHCIEWPV